MLGFDFYLKREGWVGKLPFLKKLGGKIVQQTSTRVTDIFQEKFFENAGPGGRLIRDPMVFRAVKMIVSESKNVVKAHVDISGSPSVVGRVYLNEFGTTGHGGRYSPITPKHSLVLTTPNTRGGISERATARGFPNAVWVPRGRNTSRPMLVELAPRKRPLNPNHKKPARWMYPSRQIERVIMFGVPQINIRPKFFVTDAFRRTIVQLKLEFPNLVQQNLQGLL